MTEFRSQRLTSQVFKSRANYLLACTSTAAGEASILDGGPWLCHAISKALSSHGHQSDSRSARGDQMAPGGTSLIGLPIEETRKDAPLFRDFPWVTVVIGSNCSNEFAALSGSQPIQPSAIAQCVRADPALHSYDRDDLGAIAEYFASSLLADRLPPRPGATASPSHPSVGDITTASRLVLATALLTALHNEAAAARPVAFRRNGADSVSIADGLRPLTSRHKLERPLKTLLSQLPTAVRGQTPPRSALGYLLSEVEADLNRHTIDRLSVHLLTEFSWLALVDTSTVYPGWPDLLTSLSDADPLKPDRPFQFPPRPHFTPESVSSLIQKQYLAATQQSWADRVRGHLDSRHVFYDDVASVLVAQSRLRAHKLPTVRPPAASVFVTSVDIELAMALARSSVGGFVVALPVNLYYDSVKASFRWLAAVVRPEHVGDSLEHLTRPEDWFWLSGLEWKEHLEFANWPWIVHLAGAPLFTLPRLVSGAAEPGSSAVTYPDLVRGRKPSSGITMGHATLVDEYAAMQQHSTEMFHAKTGTVTTSYGLPSQLTGGTDEIPRFWLALGVQLEDGAVRYRVASRFGPGRDGRSQSDLRSAGLAVMPHIDPSARDLLQWYGFDIVEARSDAFQADLKHYRRHLEYPDVRSHHLTDCILASSK